MSSILDRIEFQIMGWHGPNHKRYTPKAMASLAEGGLNATFSILDWDQMIPALDIAKDVGMRLVIRPTDLDLWRKPGVVDEAYLRRFGEFIAKVRNHPALLGYFIVDEPFADVIPDIARLHRAWQATDPEHLFYVNYWTVGQTFHLARGYEDLWERLLEEVPLEFISADGYPIQPVSEEDWAANNKLPHYFPRHKARLMPHYFEMLDIQRAFARQYRKPMWGFTFAKGELAQETAEGEMRFQLMTALAYGAKGLQWFSVEAGNMLINDDGSATENLRIAKGLNAVVRTWGPILQKLRSIGVYHHPANLFYTRPLDNHMLGSQNDLCSRGDPIVCGQFLDDAGMEYALLVNRNPFEPAVLEFHFGTDDTVEECSPRTAAWSRISKPRWGKMQLAAGEGKLFRFRRTIRS